MTSTDRWIGLGLVLLMGPLGACGDDGGAMGETESEGGTADTTGTASTSNGPASTPTDGSAEGTLDGSTSTPGTDTSTTSPTSGTDATDTATDSSDSTGTPGDVLELVIVGQTDSQDFPTTPGASNESYIGGPLDGFMARITIDEGAGTSDLDHATYVGGNDFEQVRDVALDSDGSIVVTGRMASQDLATTVGVFQPGYGGGPMKAFVIRFAHDGSIGYATYLGGNNYEVGYGISIDGDGYVYVSGRTSSANFPTTTGAFQENYGGGANQAPYFGGDFFIAKIEPDASAIVWASFAGGSADDMARGRNFVDTQGAVYLEGRTLSANFPTTNNAFSTTRQGQSDGGIVKLSADGSTLEWGTYLGGSHDLDAATGGIVVLDNGEAIICGYTNSGNFPATNGAAQTTQGGGFDGFVARLSPDASQILAATYLGGSGYEECQGVDVDGQGNVVAIGLTQSDDFPTTAGALQENRSGPGDMFVAKLTADLGATFITYVGGTGTETADSSRAWFDSDGDIILVGNTDSTDFPVTGNAVQTDYAGGTNDIFVLELASDGSTILYATYLGGAGDDFARSMAVR